MPRKICFIAPNLGLGGAELHLVQYANGLASRGYIVSVIVISGDDTSSNLLDPTIELKALKARTRNPATWARIILTLRTFRPDVVVGWAFWGNVLVGLLKPFIDCRSVVIELNYLPEQFKQLSAWKRHLYFALLRWSYRRADRVCANSDETLEWLRRECGSGNAYMRIYNPIDFERVHQRSLDCAEAHDLQRWVGVRILAVGRLVNRHKGFDALIDACRSLDTEVAWSLLIVGDGADREILLSQVNALGLSSRVFLVGPRRNPFPYYRCADIVVVPSRFEGFPNVLLEAMALGCATVATDCLSGPRELTLNGSVGTLVPVDDTAQLSAAISELFTSSNRREALGAEARRSILARYSTNHVFDTLEMALS